MKKLILLLGVVIGITSFALIVFYQQHPYISVSQSTFKQLPHWESDNHAQALLAFKKSCGEILKRNPDTNFGEISLTGKNQNWQMICNAATNLQQPDNQTAKAFFENWFQPYQVRSNLHTHGLFTGYYLPLLHASLNKSKDYSIPVYGLPHDLIKINLADFVKDSKNKWIIGQLSKNNLLKPYPSRIDINQKIDAPILVWGNNLIDVFFAQIQGSAIVELPNKKRLLLSYAGSNGQPYTAIGKILIANKQLEKTNISMQTIRDWLNQHPDQASSILNKNASYVFFNLLKNSDPIGSEAVPLTPKRSLAVDKNIIPLGVPIWLDTEFPTETQSNHFQHLMVAQDTGGAIKGAIRGDVYWGAGDEAAYIAGHMQSGGRYWLLLPKSL